MMPDPSSGGNAVGEAIGVGVATAGVGVSVGAGLGADGVARDDATEEGRTTAWAAATATDALVRDAVAQPAFRPVTRTVIRAPRSAAVTTWCRPVAPAMGRPLRRHS
jgi:hypothetical protein